MKLIIAALQLAILLNVPNAQALDDPAAPARRIIAPIKSVFDVVSVEKAAIQCTVNTDGKSMYSLVKGEGCAVVLEDTATKKRHSIYGGTSGCLFKVGERKTLDLVHLDCDVPRIGCSKDGKKLLYTDKFKVDDTPLGMWGRSPVCYQGCAGVTSVAVSWLRDA